MAGIYRNVFTSERVSCDAGGTIELAKVFANFPVALLVRTGDKAC
jgi:maltooligosyltrehalose synthase